MFETEEDPPPLPQIELRGLGRASPPAGSGAQPQLHTHFWHILSLANASGDNNSRIWPGADKLSEAGPTVSERASLPQTENCLCPPHLIYNEFSILNWVKDH